MNYSRKFDKNRQLFSCWKKNTGILPLNMTNDYLFKGINQVNKTALKSLLSSCMHIPVESIEEVRVQNPIMLGEAIDSKEYVLDLRVSIGNGTIVDVEMQIINYDDWPERSLQYLCRVFDSLNRGQHYLDTKTAVHIGILDFSLFGEKSTLQESYRMMNVRDHRIYTEKFQLYIVNLPEVNSATEEDIAYHTDLWARFYKARTWEELKMLASKDETIESAVETAMRLWSNQQIRDRILARDEYNRREKTQELRLKRLNDSEKTIKELNQKFYELTRKNDELNQKNDELNQKNNELSKENADLFHSLQATQEIIKKQNEGIEQNQLDLIIKKVKKGKSLSQTADEMESSEDEIRPYYNAVLRSAPEYKTDDILAAVHC